MLLQIITKIVITKKLLQIIQLWKVWTQESFQKVEFDVNNNSPIEDYVHPDDQTQPFEIIQLLMSGVAAFSENALYIMILSAPFFSLLI